jgi:hypothetical protein
MENEEKKTNKLEVYPSSSSSSLESLKSWKWKLIDIEYMMLFFENNVLPMITDHDISI